MRLSPILLVLASALALLAAAAPTQEGDRSGKRDLGLQGTPKLPDCEWHVHDGNRPQPAVITPGRGTAPPADAIVLFDGTNVDAWRNVEGKEGRWKLVEGGAMEVNETGSMETIERFGDCQLHFEWASPAEVKNEGQLRGNSGVFMMGKYEIQLLDSYENQTYPDGQCGALYGQAPPLVNASRGPGEWQTFDVVFEAPVFEDGELVSPAVATVIQNGVVVQNHTEFLGETVYAQVAQYSPHEPDGPILLQDHWFPVRFRNIWIRRL